MVDTTEFRDLASKPCSMQYVNAPASVYTADHIPSNTPASVYTTDHPSNASIANEPTQLCFVPTNHGPVSTFKGNQPPNGPVPILFESTLLMDAIRYPIFSVLPADFQPVCSPLSTNPLPPTEPENQLIQDPALLAKVSPEKPPIPVSPGIQILTTYDNSLLLSISPSDTSIPVLKRFKDSKAWWPAPLPARTGFHLPETTYTPSSSPEIYNREADADGDSRIDTPAESATVALAVFFQRSFAPLFLGTIPVDAQSLASEIVVGCPSSELCLGHVQNAGQTGSTQPDLGYLSPLLASFMARLISIAADSNIQLVPPSFPDSLLSLSSVPYTQKYNILQSSLLWRRMSETVSTLSNNINSYKPQLASLLNPCSMCGISHLPWRKRLAAIYHLIHYVLQHSPQVKAIATKSRFDWGHNPSPTSYLNSLLNGVAVISNSNKNIEDTYQKQFSAEYQAKSLTLLSYADPSHSDLAPNESVVDPNTLKDIFNGSHLSVPVPLGRHPLTGDLFWFIQNFDFNKLISIDPDFSNTNPCAYPKMGASPFQLFRETNPSIEQARDDSLPTTSDRKYWQLVASNTAELSDFCKALQSDYYREASRLVKSMDSQASAKPAMSHILAHRLNSIHIVFAKMLVVLKTILPRLGLGETTKEWELARNEYLNSALGQEGADELQKELEKQESLAMTKENGEDLGQGGKEMGLDINQSIAESGIKQSVSIADTESDPDPDHIIESTDYHADSETTIDSVISSSRRITRSRTNPKLFKKHIDPHISPASSTNHSNAYDRPPSSGPNTRSKTMQSSNQDLESNDVIVLTDEETETFSHDTSTEYEPSVDDSDSLNMSFTNRKTRITCSSTQENDKRQTRQSRRFNKEGRRETDRNTKTKSASKVDQDLERIATQPDTEEVINLSDEEERLSKRQVEKNPRKSVTKTKSLPVYQELPFPNSIGIAPIAKPFQRSVERNQRFEKRMTRHEGLWKSTTGVASDSPKPADEPFRSTNLSSTTTTRSNSFNESQDEVLVDRPKSTAVSKRARRRISSDDEYDGIGQFDHSSTTSRHYKRTRLREADASVDPVEDVILVDSDDSSIISPTLSPNWSPNWFSSSLQDIPEPPRLLQYLNSNPATTQNYVDKSGDWSNEKSQT